MIQCNLLGTRSDGKKVYTRFSEAYINIETRQFVTEIPEGADASEYSETFYGKVRCDQTGIIYETAHDVEDSEHTYTEVFFNPAEAVSSEVSQVTGGGLLVTFNMNDYPAWKSSETYAEGDIVTYSPTRKTYISDFDNNIGNTPNLYGWSVYLPHIHDRNYDGDLVYKSLEEWEEES